MEELRPGTVNPKINPILKGTFSVISNDLKRILIYRRNACGCSEVFLYLRMINIYGFLETALSIEY